MKTKASYAVWANPSGKNYDFCVCIFPDEIRSKKAAKKYAAANGWALCPDQPDPWKR